MDNSQVSQEIAQLDKNPLSTAEAAAKKIYNYLDTQHIGQYTYRRDIGILT